MDLYIINNWQTFYPTLSFEKAGSSKVIEAIITDIDRGLGDIPMEMSGV